MTHSHFIQSRFTRLGQGLATRGRHLIRSTSLATVLGIFAVSSLLLPAWSQAQETATAQAQELARAEQVATVNINTADAQALASALKGVGMSKAEAIVRYREAYGAFESVDELADVKGIGAATLDKNRAAITLE